jgi:hypothetical protein
MPDDQDQGRPARNEIAVAREPKLAGGKERIDRGDGGDQTDGGRHGLRDAAELKGSDPYRRARGEHNDRDAPALEAARAAPHECVGGADQRISAADRPSVRQAAGRDKQRRAGGANQVSSAPQRQRRGVAVLQKGEQQQQAADDGNKERHRKQRRQVENEMGSIGMSFPTTPDARTCALLAAQFCGLVAGLLKIEASR